MTERDYWITVDPAHKPIEPQAKVRAINALHALDLYAVGQGFGAYEDLDPPLSDWLGVDQYGIWGTFTNCTIWAIPALKGE